MSWEKLRDILGTIVATSAVLLTLGGWLLHTWIDKAVDDAVDAKFTDAGSVAPHRMDQAEKDIGELKAEDDKLDDKITRIIDILLED